MSDNLNELGKNLKSNRKRTSQGLGKNRHIIPQTERVRDIMDPTVAFELEFKTKINSHRVYLNLDFMPPPSSACCEGCSCTACDFFNGGATETTYILTYAYIPGTARVFINNEPSTQFVETEPAQAEIVVYAHNDDEITVCYVYNICIGGETVPASFPTECKVYIDNLDCTYWMFGSDTISPDEIQHRWRNIDISQWVKTPGLHTLRVTSGAGVGRVDARVEIS